MPKRNPQLEQAILEGRAGAWEVYADWLLAQGDVHGELASLVLRKPGQVRTYVKARAPALFGELAMLLDDQTIEVRDWHPGFVRTLAVKPNQANDDDLGVLLKELLAAPFCAFLEGLVVTSPPETWREGLAPLSGSPQAARLKRLELQGYGWDDGGDLSALLPTLPQLEVLHGVGAQTELGKPTLPHLRELSWSATAPPAQLRALIKSRLPRLERLELAMGYEDESGDSDELDAEPAPVAAMLGPLKRRTLSELTVSGARFGDEALEQLLDAPGFTSLKLLDLDGSYIDEEGEGVLRDHLERLQRIKRVKLPRVGVPWDHQPLELGLDDGDDD